MMKYDEIFERWYEADDDEESNGGKISKSLFDEEDDLTWEPHGGVAYDDTYGITGYDGHGYHGYSEEREDADPGETRGSVEPLFNDDIRWRTDYSKDRWEIFDYTGYGKEREQEKLRKLALEDREIQSRYSHSVYSLTKPTTA